MITNRIPDRLRTFLLAAFLFGLNLWIVKELLSAEFLDQMYSIEGTQIALTRFVMNHWPDLNWFPAWYGGIPFVHTYVPLHPLTSAAIAKTFGLTPQHACHATMALFYSLGPVTLFLLALHISRSRAYSFVAALLYALASPSAVLVSVVRWDTGSVWHARRLQSLVHYGEGPHIMSMTYAPLALLLLIIAIEKRRAVWWFPAGLAMAAVAMSNWIGAFCFAFAVLAWLAARTETVRDLRTWGLAAAGGLYAYALACCWLPPSVTVNTQRNEMLMMGIVSALPVRLAMWSGVVAAIAGLWWLLRKLRCPFPLRFALLYLLPMAWLTLAYEWFQLRMLPQANRCHLEMEMGIVLVTAFGAKLVFERFPARVRTIAACLLVVAAVYPAVRYRRYAKRLDRHIDIHQTIEYREARWLDEHHYGGRVSVPGSVSFYLNDFTDVPHLGGGFDQGQINFFYSHARYQITSGDSAAVPLLQALGVDLVGVSGPHSTEVFRPFRNPKKFEGVLPAVWRDGDNALYLVPRRSRSLAHVLSPADLPARVPQHGLDVDAFAAYVRALEDPSLPEARLVWHGPSRFTVSAPVQSSQVLSVQMTYHPGWHATVNGEPRTVRPDNLGHFFIEPRCAGPCTVEVAYNGGAEALITRIVSWTALLLGILWSIAAAVRTRVA